MGSCDPLAERYREFGEDSGWVTSQDREPWKLTRVVTVAGPTLQDVFAIHDSEISLTSIALVGLRLSQKLEAMHARSAVHGHISPDRVFLDLQNGEQDLIIVTQPGVMKAWRNSGRGDPPPNGRFASADVRRGAEPTFKDDLDSAARMLIYLCGHPNEILEDFLNVNESSGPSVTVEAGHEEFRKHLMAIGSNENNWDSWREEEMFPHIQQHHEAGTYKYVPEIY